MNWNRIAVCFIYLSICVFGKSQNGDWCILGRILDNENGEPIAFVHVATSDLSIGTVSNGNGLFELCFRSDDSVQIKFFHTAFEPLVLRVKPSGANQLEVKLRTKKYLTEEVTVSGSGKSLVKSPVPGKIELKQQDILLTPSVLGAPDLVRTLQLMPGIQSVNEGNSGIYVRGGSPGHNYIVFDEIELMNPSHLMGIYSVFNPLLVDKVEFYKGNAPVHQASRLASSIIVNTNDRKDAAYNWSGNWGNISSNLSYQGMSKNQKWYFSLGFRRSYLEALQALAKPFINDEDNYFVNNTFNFYDLNGKIRYQNGASALALSWYKGRDVFQFNNSDRAVALDNEWGNEGAAFSWKYMMNAHLSMKNVISYAGYKSSLAVDFIDQNLKFETDYKQYQFKNEFLLQTGNHVIRWGAHVTRKDISPQDIDISLNTNSGTAYNSYKHLSVKLPVSDRYTFSDRWEVYLGAAFEYYKLLDKTQERSEEVLSEKNSTSDILSNIVAMANYDLSKVASLKSSYGFISQNIHLASIASIPLPSDIWMPATKKAPAETGHQFTLGYFREMKGMGIEFGVEAYGKLSDNSLMLKVNVEDKEVDDFEDNFYSGSAKSLGTEFTVKKTAAKYNANISYTLGWTRQKFDQINQGAWHEAKYDRRHDLNFLGSCLLNSRWELGTAFVFATGNKATLPKGRYWMMGDISNDYEGVNNYRMPVYHRLDLSLNYRLKSKWFHESILNFSLINVLNRSNPYFIYYHIDDGEGTYELSIKARQVSLFPIMPSVSWRYKF
ncbi:MULTISPECIES: TonB-dependent receptor [unclassified Saccharicrinis]|uniref:TonB-dependent receptor n=1 Tax=unclassified Saccharicrinis TaxID=2646859 RepID=UPI003D351ED7